MSKSINPLRSIAALSAAAVMAISAHAQTVVTSNNLPGIFDASFGTRELVFTALEIGAGGLITDVNISINFAKADGEGTSLGSGDPFFNETVFNLTYGSTTTALISAGSFNVGSGPYSGTINFDDEAARVVNFDPNLIPSSTSSLPNEPFRPVGSLGVFDGLSLTPGDWTLFIQDTVGADSLRFYSATLEVTYDGVGAVPEPSTYGLMGAGLLAAVLLRRRLKAAKA